MSAPWRRWRQWLAEEGRAAGLPLGALMALAAALHAGVTLLAVNPWHPDEHFQILEFAWARAGLAPLADLPWEFPARIRPTIQPTLAIGALGALRAVGIDSPYPWVLVLRLGSLALALTVLAYVCARVAPTLGRAGRRTLWLSALFLWFLPLLTSRFTSENWGGLALVAAIPMLDSGPGRGRDYASGALLGLSFTLRFQMAFACAALVLWLLAQGRSGRGRALRVVAGALPVVALGVVCDAWFYGAWVLTPWEYLRTNLIEGVASTFGTSPWYWYLAQTPLWMAPPLGLAVVALCALAVARRPMSPWVWAPLAFLLGHSLIAHKELRFLFPMVYALPVLIAMGVDALARGEAATPRWQRAAGGALAAQSLALAALLLTPSVHRGKEFDWHFYRFLWESAEARPGDTIYVLHGGEGPYRVWDLEGHVYRHARVRGVPYAPDAPLAALVPAGTPPDALLFVTRDRRPPRVRGAEDFELVYGAESGYRRTARALGLEDAGFVRWLEQVDRWTDSQWVRRVYRVGAGAAGTTDGSGPNGSARSDGAGVRRSS
jgi:hypothetical protein